MIKFNEYIHGIDFTVIKELFLEKGTSVAYKKHECFVEQNGISLSLGYIESGIFRYIRTDNKGEEHIVGYGFSNEFIGDYSSFIKHSKACVDIQAVTNSTVWVLPTSALNDYYETNMVTQRFARSLAEELFVEIYGRLLTVYCQSTEERYVELIKRHPHLSQYITLKEMASYLNVTPETISHIRKRLLLRQKS